MLTLSQCNEARQALFDACAKQSDSLKTPYREESLDMLVDRYHKSALGVDNKLFTKLPQAADYKSGFDDSSFLKVGVALKADS